MLLSAAAAPAHAQNAPPGSYLRSCQNVQTQGDRLVADCRRADGSWGRTSLDVDRCVGGIANMDGRLTCNHSDRSYGRSRDQDNGQRQGYNREPGYGTSYGPQGGFGR
jgi:CVNH domain